MPIPWFVAAPVKAWLLLAATASPLAELGQAPQLQETITGWPIIWIYAFTTA
ncbi:MAG: hypothetical protein HYV35_08265 [Lentisphaerae bacterium]|nr:hypothetical protein [Lentisphaerota bacterium]